jgi:hypothetical protein
LVLTRQSSRRLSSKGAPEAHLTEPRNGVRSQGASVSCVSAIRFFVFADRTPGFFVFPLDSCRIYWDLEFLWGVPGYFFVSCYPTGASRNVLNGRMNPWMQICGRGRHLGTSQVRARSTSARATIRGMSRQILSVFFLPILPGSSSSFPHGLLFFWRVFLFFLAGLFSIAGLFLAGPSLLVTCLWHGQRSPAPRDRN